MNEDTLWYWIKERHTIHLRRESDQPWPWTHDPILQNYRFCNPFRENDKVTTWLREHVLNSADVVPSDILAFKIVLFRWFNRIETARVIGMEMPSWRWGDHQRTVFHERLTMRLAAGIPIFTGAYIIRSEFGKPKLDSIFEAATRVWANRRELVKVIEETQSLQATAEWLQQFPLLGPFMSYEMVTDMRHTRLLENASDIMTWANPGPGAMRGIQRIYGKVVRGMYIPLMRDLLSRAPGELEDLIDCPTVEMRDIEHSLCEFDKYSRVKLGEGRPRQKYKRVFPLPEDE